MDVILGKDAILGADDLISEDVEVEQWGGVVRVRTMIGSERDAFEAAVLENNQSGGTSDIRARLVALTVISDKGERLFEEADIAALGKKSSAALDKVFAVSQRLNGLTRADVEELEKNL